MASYFDAQPRSKTTAEALNVPGAEVFGRPSLLSPQVTNILGELDDESSSDEGAGVNSQSEGEDSHEQDRGRSSGRDGKDADASKTKRKTNFLKVPGQEEDPSTPPPKPGASGAGARPKHPHMARFHSLRSVLFSSRIEADLKKSEELNDDDDPEAKWKAEHEQRRGLNRPKTPEAPANPAREGIVHRMSSTLRKMRSKETGVPTMKGIREDGNESTASTDEEGKRRNIEMGKKHDEQYVSDDESIHHSDVEDLVRWVHRRDPPSDGEKRKKQRELNPKEISKHDGGHESLGHSDVDDLLLWVSRKDEPKEEHAKLPDNYSNAPTESDSEDGVRQRADGHSSDEDADELVRWISRKEGPKAGPIKQSKKGSAVAEKSGSEAHDSDIPELARWVSRRDETSGESDIDGPASELPSPKGHGSTEHTKATEDDGATENNTLRPEDAKASRPPLRETLTNEDVDELVRWVSSRNIRRDQEEEREDDILKWKKQEDEKKEAVGMTVPEGRGSLADGDVDDLVEWVGQRKGHS